MGLLSMSEREYKSYIKEITEATKLIGQKAMLYQLSSEVKDIYRDPTLTFIDKVEIGIIFEENPKPILKKYKWLTEDDELPYVCYIVAKDLKYNDLDIREHMVIDIENEYGYKDNKKFTISNIRGNSIDPLMYICKLVPYREKIDLKPSTPEYDNKTKETDNTNYSYLNYEE